MMSFELPVTARTGVTIEQIAAPNRSNCGSYATKLDEESAFLEVQLRQDKDVLPVLRLGIGEIPDRFVKTYQVYSFCFKWIYVT